MKTPRTMMISSALFAAMILVFWLSGGCRTASLVPGEPPAEASVAPSPEAVDMASSAALVDEATAKDPADEGPVYRNTVKWKTASEVDNFGFDVYRAATEEGPFERINSGVIEGAGTTDEPSSYQFVDDTIDPHQAYFYYVESISMSGVREQFTPIGKIRPKIEPTDEAEAGGDSGGVR